MTPAGAWPVTGRADYHRPQTGQAESDPDTRLPRLGRASRLLAGWVLVLKFLDPKRPVRKQDSKFESDRLACLITVAGAGKGECSRICGAVLLHLSVGLSLLRSTAVHRPRLDPEVDSRTI